MAKAPRTKPPARPALAPTHHLDGPDLDIYVGDCREVLAGVTPGSVDLVFADPPFNWNRAYDQWHDAMPEDEYLTFTFDWLDLCIRALRPGGSFWINIPDDWAAEITCYLKGRFSHRKLPTPRHAPLHMENWCVWHYRFGQNTKSRFINSKVHALHFVTPGGEKTWNPEAVLEVSDRAAIYSDPRTQSKKDGLPPGLRVPMDVWYGPFWGRIQGNNKERRARHDNQLPEVYLERVVRACSNPGDLVMDPFTGSGTTAVVARALHRRFIGSEFSKANAASAFERIKKGPVRPLVADQHVSSAIVAPRTRKAKAAAALGGPTVPVGSNLDSPRPDGDRRATRAPKLAVVIGPQRR